MKGEPVRTANDVNCAVFHPTGAFVAIGDRAGNVSIIDTQDGGILAFFAIKPPVMALAFAPDGTGLAVGGGEGSLEFWDFAALCGMIHSNRHFREERLKKSHQAR